MMHLCATNFATLLFHKSWILPCVYCFVFSHHYQIDSWATLQTISPSPLTVWWESILPILGFLGLSVLELGRGTWQPDGQTDRQTDIGHHFIILIYDQVPNRFLNSRCKRRQWRDTCNCWVFNKLKSSIKLSLNIVKEYADGQSCGIGDQRRYAHQTAAVCRDTAIVTTVIWL